VNLFIHGGAVHVMNNNGVRFMNIKRADIESALFFYEN